MFKRFQELTLNIVDLVNSPRKTQRIIRNSTVPRMILKDFVEIARMMDQKRFFAGSLGEMSVRIKGGKFLISPANIPTCYIDEESLLLTAIEKDIDLGVVNPPIHLNWHREIFKNSNASAVILCQPRNACAMANQMQKPEKGVLVDADKILETVSCVLPEDLIFRNTYSNDLTLFIKSVGVLTWGSSLIYLLDRIEMIERMCEISMSVGSLSKQ